MLLALTLWWKGFEERAAAGMSAVALMEIPSETTPLELIRQWRVVAENGRIVEGAVLVFGSTTSAWVTPTGTSQLLL